MKATVADDRAWVPVPGLGVSVECLVLEEGKSAALSLSRLVAQCFEFHWEDERSLPTVFTPDGHNMFV